LIFRLVFSWLLLISPEAKGLHLCTRSQMQHVTTVVDIALAIYSFANSVDRTKIRQIPPSKQVCAAD
jgi:hypothetical protein